MGSQSQSQKSIGRAFTVALILRKLDQGEYAQQIARDLNKSKQVIHYYVKRLEQLGYIQRTIRDRISIYELLPKGKDALERHDKFVSRGVMPRVHHYAVKCVVLGRAAGLEGFLPLRDGVALRGGVVQVDGVFKLDGEGFSVRRFHSPSSEQLFLYAPIVYERSVADALTKSAVKVDRVARAIQERYGLQLSEPVRFQRPEFAYERDPFARLWGDIAGTVVKTEEGAIDASEGDWETEFYTAESADAYLKMPLEIREIKRVFADAAVTYKKTTEQFGKEMASHLELINSIAELARSTTGVTKELKEVVDEMRKPKPTTLRQRVLRIFRGPSQSLL